MIYGNIYDGITEKGYSPMILEAVEYLKNTDFSAMEPGRYEIDGDRFFANVSLVTTRPKEERTVEGHTQYLDVQFLAEGHELIGTYPNDGRNEVLEVAGPDCVLYKNRSDVNEIMLPMTKGCYAVLFPEDLHRPSCAFGEPEEIRKVVLKIRVAE